MCWLCDSGKPQLHGNSQLGRRDFLKTAAATGLTAGALNLFAARPAKAQEGGNPPADSGQPGRRYIIRGGAVMSMDPKVGNFAKADVLVEGKKIQKIGPNLSAGGAEYCACADKMATTSCARTNQRDSLRKPAPMSGRIALLDSEEP